MYTIVRGRGWLAGWQEDSGHAPAQHMTTTFVACGSRGDVEPVLQIALTYAAQLRGHGTESAGGAVRFVTNREHGGLVTSSVTGAGVDVSIALLSAAPATVWRTRCVCIIVVYVVGGPVVVTVVSVCSYGYGVSGFACE